MKTMKFLAVLALLSFSMNTMAQNAMQMKLKENKSALKEKASKSARQEAKRLKKENWNAAPGGLPMDKQLDRLFLFLEDFDENMTPLYIDGRGQAIAENIAAAQVQATELARLDLVGKISTEATGIIDNMIGNKMLADDQAASISTALAEYKTFFSQKLGRVQTPLVLTRVLKNNNKEVLVRMVTKKSSVEEIAKEAIREELTKGGKELSDELKAFFGKD